MMKSIAMRLIVGCGLCCGVAVCAAQTYTPPPPPLTTLPPCPVDKDAKRRAKRKDCDPTVYPSETIETKGKKGSGAAASPASNDQPVPTPAEKANPFPGDSSADMPSDTSTAKKHDDTPAGTPHPYPGDDGKDVPYNPADDPAEKGKPVPPHDPAAAKRAEDTSAGKANPFPDGATPDMPGNAAEPTPKPDNSTSGSSGATPPGSSSSTSSSSSDDAAGSDASKSSRNAPKNPDDDDEDKPKLTDKGSEGKRNKKVIKPQTDTDRVDEDLSIAKFYGQSGNYTGAYMRAKDAVKTQPEYPEGHFVLGEAALRLKKKDEAVAEFQAYLKLAPDGQQAKAAEKALDELK